MRNDEIDDVTKPGAISQIPGDAREQKRASPQHAVVISRRAQEIVKHSRCRRDGEHYEKPAAETSALLQLTESNSAVLRIDEIDKAPDDSSIICMPQRAHCPCLGGLIDQVDAEAGQQVTRAPTEARARIREFRVIKV